MPKSCITCPSYIAGDDLKGQKEHFNRPVGGPICGRFGALLGSTRSTEGELEAIAVVVAEGCDSHGLPKPQFPEVVEPYISEVPVTVNKRGPYEAGPNSCRNCRYFVSEETVHDKWGWSLGACAAFGKLLFRPLAEARGCDTGVDGGPDANSEGLITIMPRLREGFRLPEDMALKQYVFAGHASMGEPTEYDSDAPVTPENITDGIRAWRKITNPKNEQQYVFAPIMRRDIFTEDEQALIPSTGGQGNPQLYVDYNGLLYDFFVETFILDETPVLVGPAGTGKTQFFRWVGWLQQMPFRRIQFYDEMDVTEMLGSVQYDPQKGTFFEPGVLPIAWQAVGILDLDEPNLAPDEVRQVLRPVTDNSKQLIVENRVFPRNDYCFLGMSMNHSHDFRNIGTKELADADANRLSFLETTLPPEPVERHIIRTYCQTLDDYDISESTISTLLAISTDIRDLEQQGQYPNSWATRQIIKVARKTRWYDMMDAFRKAALNNMPQEVRELVYTSITSHTGLEAPTD